MSEAKQMFNITIRNKTRNTIVSITDYAARHPVAWKAICCAIGIVTAILAAVLAKYCGTIGTIIGNVIRLSSSEILKMF